MIGLIAHDVEQGTDEWLQARCGLLTASVVGQLVTPTLKVARNDTARSLVRSLAGERISGQVDFLPPTADMRRGTEDEPIARAYYEDSYAPVTELGMFELRTNTFRLGYSPDGLVGDDGLIEIKSRKPKKHIQTVLDDSPPAENMAQLQAGLFVTGRSWIDYVSYSAGLPLWVKRVFPDPAWFDAIEAAAEQFEKDMAETIERFTAAVAGFPETEPREENDDLDDIEV